MKSRSRAGTTQHHNSQHHLTHKSPRTQMKCAWLVAWCHWAIQLSICPRLDDVAPRWLAASWENEIIFLFDIISGGSGWNLYSWKCSVAFFLRQFDWKKCTATAVISKRLWQNCRERKTRHNTTIIVYSSPAFMSSSRVSFSSCHYASHGRHSVLDFGLFGPFCCFTWVARSIEVLLGSQRSAWHVCRFVWETGQKASRCITHARHVHLFADAHLMVLFARLTGELSFGLLWWLRTAQGEVGYQCVAL